MSDPIERLNDRGEISAILALNHPRLVERERADPLTVFVWADCDECCGWRSRPLSRLRTEVNPGVYYWGEDGFATSGELVVRMANDCTLAEGL